jgi:hypothetical protein
LQAQVGGCNIHLSSGIANIYNAGCTPPMVTNKVSKIWHPIIGSCEEEKKIKEK